MDPCNKTHCVSILNPEAAGDNAFLVFDYSVKTGQALGKPWTIVKKGECYKTEDGTEAVYLVEGAERIVFSDYSNYSPSDSISQVFCDNESSCFGYEAKYSITSISLAFRYAVTIRPSEVIHFTGITANSLYPTKYDFGDPVTSRSSWAPPEITPIVNDPSFVSVWNLYDSLTEQLNSTLRSCDSRVRIERQYSLNMSEYAPNNEYYDGTSGLSLKNILWRLADNQNVSIPVDNEYAFTLEDELSRIDIMGCKAALNTFIQAHQADFTTVDRLAENIIAKYPNALCKSGSEYCNTPIILRKSAEISKIPALTQEQETATSTVLAEPTPINEQETVAPTVLDEPTPEKKLEMLAKSSNPLMRVYVLLPLIALIGALAFFVFRKK